jgi:GLPGLI family protein
MQLKEQGELLFNTKETLYDKLPVAAADEEGGTGMVVQSTGNMVTYVNLTMQQKTEYREAFGSEYLVSGHVTRGNWTLTQTSKDILGYKAYLAYQNRVDTMQRVSMENGEMKQQYFTDSVRVDAWYVPGIPVAAGPAEFSGQLPGLVLEVMIGKGELHLLATEISGKLDAGQLKKPTRGKPVTQAEFRAEFKKLSEEMLKNRPASKTIRQ